MTKLKDTRAAGASRDTAAGDVGQHMGRELSLSVLNDCQYVLDRLVDKWVLPAAEVARHGVDMLPQRIEHPAEPVKAQTATWAFHSRKSCWTSPGDRSHDPGHFVSAP